MNHKQIEDYILSKPGATLEYPFGAETAVYKVMDKMFALIAEGKVPVRLNLKCDPLLAKTLRERYMSVQPGYHMNKKHWNSLILTGELSDQEVFDLVDLSYRLVTEGLSKEDQAKLGLEAVPEA